MEMERSLTPILRVFMALALALAPALAPALGACSAPARVEPPRSAATVTDSPATHEAPPPASGAPPAAQAPQAFGATAASLAPLSAQPLRIQRLARLGMLWGAIRYLHPFLPQRDIDWDRAVLAAIPRVSAAASTDEYVAAISDMMSALADPVTRVARDASAQPGGDVPMRFRMLDGNVLLVDLGNGDALSMFIGMMDLPQELPRARAVIFDMRKLPAELRHALPFLFTRVQEHLLTRPVEMPVHRGVIHSGYAPHEGATSGGYQSMLATAHAQVVSPVPGRAPGDAPGRVVFVLGDPPMLPELAVALHATGQGAVVAAGPVGDGALAYTRIVDLGEGWHAEVRTSEVLHRGRPIAIAPDARVAAAATGDSDPALAAAMRLARQPPRRRPAPAPVAAQAALWKPDRAYEDQPLPSLELRILAAYRLWNVIHHFYPYLELIGDWEPVLPLAITAMEAAASPEDYGRAVARIAAFIADSHTTVLGDQVTAAFGGAPPPLSARMIEGVPVVTEIFDVEAAPGIEVGDVITTLDGEPVAAAMARRRPYVAGSHEAALQYRLIDDVLSGANDSRLRLGLRGKQDRVKEVEITRSVASYAKREQRASARVPYRLIEPGIGYVDLTVIVPAQVDAMFEELRDTRALIFDLRGYPRGTAWSIAPRINRHQGVTYGAMFQRMVVSGLTDEETQQGRFQFMQPIPTTDAWRYQGKIFVMIDERAISQSEHTALFFEATAGARFIGSNTQGANGDVTSMVLPGGVTVMFTGHDVRHADGRQLQRIGIEPHVRVTPTIAGLRAGKDEVLEAALREARAALLER
jgi:C-terminal processing protease CtpA/Prc